MMGFNLSVNSFGNAVLVDPFVRGPRTVAEARLHLPVLAADSEEATEPYTPGDETAIIAFTAHDGRGFQVVSWNGTVAAKVVPKGTGPDENISAWPMTIEQLEAAGFTEFEQYQRATLEAEGALA